MKPVQKPANPNFSSGPCSKRPGYDVSALSIDTLGRSHRSALGKATLAGAITALARAAGSELQDVSAFLSPAEEGVPEVGSWPREALELLDVAEARLRAGDWAGFGAALDELRALLGTLSAEGGGGS